MALYAGVDRGFAMPECPGGPAYSAINIGRSDLFLHQRHLKYYCRPLCPVTASGDEG